MPREISTAREITDLALGAVGRLPARPWFLWVHYFDPHDAYLAHQGLDFGPAPIDRYDSEIAYTDRQIGRLLDELRRRKLLERTLVVLLADHGEGFGAHGQLYHSTTLFDELLHVPLLLRVPGLAPARFARDVGMIDIAPTLLGLLGLPIPQPFRGRPLEISGDRFVAGDDRMVVSETHRDVDLRSIRQGRWKLIADMASGGRKLFDVAADPGERRNLRKREPQMASRLESVLAAHYAAGSTSAPRREIPEDLERRLRSLGYVE
jgi:arylsulfatase A-like enzyme